MDTHTIKIIVLVAIAINAFGQPILAAQRNFRSMGLLAAVTMLVVLTSGLMTNVLLIPATPQVSNT